MSTVFDTVIGYDFLDTSKISSSDEVHPITVINKVITFNVVIVGY